jgi:hypothetical protein
VPRSIHMQRGCCKSRLHVTGSNALCEVQLRAIVLVPCSDRQRSREEHCRDEENFVSLVKKHDVISLQIKLSDLQVSGCSAHATLRIKIN